MADRETVRLLAQLGERVFIPLFLQPTRKKFPCYAENPIEALKLFLSAYAFERQGSAPFYKELSVEALENLSRDSLCSASFSRNLWDKFGELARDRKTNCKVNPLWPGRAEDHRCDVVAVTCSEALAQDDHNLYRFASRNLKSDRLRCAWDVSQRIRGIGPKIASLFLRDVALDQNVPESLRDRELLQPIDIWLRRIVSQLAGWHDDFKSDEAARKEAVQLANEAHCCALLLNAGSWYFGSQIARTVQSLNKALESPESIRRSIDKHRERLQDESQRLSGVLCP